MRVGPGVFVKSEVEGRPPIRCAGTRMFCEGRPEIRVLDKEYSDRRGAKIMISLDDLRQRDKPELTGAFTTIHLYQDDVDMLRAAIAEFDRIPAEARL